VRRVWTLLLCTGALISLLYSLFLYSVGANINYSNPSSMFRMHLIAVPCVSSFRFPVSVSSICVVVYLRLRNQDPRRTADSQSQSPFHLSGQGSRAQARASLCSDSFCSASYSYMNLSAPILQWPHIHPSGRFLSVSPGPDSDSFVRVCIASFPNNILINVRSFRLDPFIQVGSVHLGLGLRSADLLSSVFRLPSSVFRLNSFI
jgi:hypothetical protein